MMVAMVLMVVAKVDVLMVVRGIFAVLEIQALGLVLLNVRYVKDNRIVLCWPEQRISTIRCSFELFCNSSTPTGKPKPNRIVSRGG